MSVLVDTSIWSVLLRRKDVTKLKKSEKDIKSELIELIRKSDVLLIGPIRQEILSGIKDKKIFNQIRDTLKDFNDILITLEDYELAAEFFNKCKSKGIAGSHIDYLICAVAFNNNIELFTCDKDFDNYKKVINIKIHKY